MESTPSERVSWALDRELMCFLGYRWGFLQIRGIMLGIPRIRIISFGLYWGTLFWETTR